MRVQPTFNLWLTPETCERERVGQRAERDAPTTCTCGAGSAGRGPVSDVEADFAPAGRPRATSFQVDPMLDWFKP